MMILQGSQTPYIWTLRGTVLSGVAPDETNNVGEPNVIYEGSPQILAGTVFKMWYTSGWASPEIHYAESTDGISWTKYGSNPVLAAHCRPSVFKDGSTYYMFAANVANTQIDLYSSADGVSWSLVQSAAIGLGTAGAWDDTTIANTFVWKEGANDYRMLYEAKTGAGGIWKIGYATSTNLTSWTKSGSNPVVSETGSVGGPMLYKAASGAYWLWVHHSLSSTLPTDLERYTSSNLTTWTKDPLANTLTRGSGDGNGSANGQIADAMLVETGGQVYMWYSGNPDGSVVTGHSVIKLATSSRSLESLVNTVEGP